MPPLQNLYFDLLIERVRADRYPSHQLLDRIESSFWTAEQITEYTAVLLEKVADSHYPSHQILDRVERMMMLVASAA